MNRLTKFAIVKYSEIVKNMNTSNLSESFNKIDKLKILVGPEVELKAVNYVMNNEI